MKHVPDLKNLSIALHRPEEYSNWVSEHLATLENETEVSSGTTSLFHHADSFDSSFFTMHCGKVENVFGENRKEIKKVVEYFFAHQPYEYCLFRISQQHIDWIQFIQMHGALFLDSTVDLVFDVRKKTIIKGEVDSQVTNSFSASLEAQIIEIADSFCFGRFYTDPDVRKGAEIYKEWIKNSLLKKAADECYILTENEQVHGLLTVKGVSMGTMKGWKVPLIGKHNLSEKKRVSERLLRHLISQATQNEIDFILISTQGTNVPALRGYINAGFEIYSSGVTLGWKKDR